MENYKLCPYCKVNKLEEYFTRIIKRKDYAIDSDDEGYSLYLKNTILCLDCRIIYREKNKKKLN